MKYKLMVAGVIVISILTGVTVAHGYVIPDVLAPTRIVQQTNTPRPPRDTPTPVPTGQLTPTPTPDPDGSCTEVLGASVTANWYGGYYVGFEQYVNDGEYQLRWKSFAILQKWTDPNYAGWLEPLISPCTQNSQSPNRIIFEVMGYNESVEQVEHDLRIVIGHIRDKYPGAVILIHPIVGGPNHQLCYYDRNGELLVVDASYWHPLIDPVIDELVTDGTIDAATISTELDNCDPGYLDDRGHLDREGKDEMAEKIGQWYALYAWP